jgi:hypothetical protein
MYRDAYDATLQELQRAVVEGLDTSQRVALLQELANRVAELRAQTLSWAYGPVDPRTGRRTLSRAALYAAIAQADRETLRQLAAIGLKVEVPKSGAMSASFALLNDTAIRVVAENLVISLNGAIDQFDRSVRGIIGRAQNDLFRWQGLETVGQKLTEGLTVRQGRARMVNDLTEKGITAFVDSRGRSWNLKSYSDMVVRTTTREATSEATLRRVEAEGHDYLIATKHRPTCPICAARQGRVYCISGKDPRFPSLKSVGNTPWHGNCGHSFVPWSENYEPNLDEVIAQSGRPMDVDPRSAHEVELYERSQKIKLEQRRKRNLSVQMQAPNLDPKEKERLRKLRSSANRRLIDMNKSQRKALPGWR